MPEECVVTWRHVAEADLASIIDYISDRNPVAAQTLKSLIMAKIDLLPANPKAYRSGRQKQTRELIITPNYIVIYAEQNAGILILRVLHTSRKWPQ